jgi:hypothetical protein
LKGVNHRVEAHDWTSAARLRLILALLRVVSPGP